MLHFKLPLARVLLLLPLEISLRNQTRQAFISDDNVAGLILFSPAANGGIFYTEKCFKRLELTWSILVGAWNGFLSSSIIKHPDTWNREKPIFKIISSSEVLRCNRLMTVHFLMVANQISQWSNHLEINEQQFIPPESIFKNLKEIN